MSQPTFSLPQASGATGPQPGLAGPQPGLAGVQPGAVDVNQNIQAQQLAAIASQQQAAAQAAAQQAPEDKSKGWSLTNPFQDIGQIWHDVETHTIAPVFHAANWLFTNLIKRPYTAATLYSARNEYKAQTGHENWSWFQGSQWGQAWEDSAHISPGQATLVAMQDQKGMSWSDKQLVDPSSTEGVHHFISNSWGNRVASGLTDAAIDWFADPTVKMGQGIKALKGIKDAPITRADNEAQALAKLNSPSSQAFNAWAVGKPISVLAEHPLVKGTGRALNPFPNKSAALIAGAKTPEEVGLIRQIMAGIPSTTTGIAAQTGNVDTVGKALDKLSQTAPNAAVQVSNMLIPLEIGEKAALTPAGDDEIEQWLQRVSHVKAFGLQQDINVNSDRAQQILDLLNTQSAKTTTSAVTNKLAQLRGSLKYANLRDVDGVTTMHNALYNFPLRVYHGLTDRPAGLINHRDDTGADVARSWLNKSSTLTPDQKVDYIQRYAQANFADRQHVWDSIESDVYKQVGERFGVDNSTMQKILNTTKTKQGNFTRAAVSRAYGGAKIQSGATHAVLPSFEDTVTLSPKYITQLEAGAAPVANLKSLENALEAMDRNPDSVLSVARRVGPAAMDKVLTSLDSVYGIWKPLSLMTGHRAYNHVGDDFLRGAAKLGALTTIQNAAGGAANFLKNVYAASTKVAVARNTEWQHAKAMSDAKAEYEGLRARQQTQRDVGLSNIPEDLRIKASDIKAKKDVYDQLRGLRLDFIQEKHRLGSGDFPIAGSGVRWPEAFGGPNGDWVRRSTSSHPTFDSYVDDAAHSNHDMLTAINTRDFGTLSPIRDSLDKHTAAYVHYVKNQMLPDPVVKQLLAGRDPNDVAGWLMKTTDGRNHMKALHIGDPNDWVDSIAEDIQTHLPFDGMKDEAVAGKFSAKTIENYMPDAGMRPNVSGRLNSRLYGGDPTTNLVKNWTQTAMKWTGTLPDDIMVRHPIFNSLYKNRLTDNVQQWVAQTDKDVTDGPIRDLLIRNSMAGARKDLQNLVYDVSRFNDMGHTLRFISPFFNAWYNAMTSWSKLFLENPTLLGRTYQAKRALWDSPFAIDNTTGQKADVNTPWQNTSFVLPMPKGLASSFGDFGSVPIDAKTLVSPTYIDSIGNPGFGPLVAIPVNQIVLDHPSLMNDAVVRSMLNNMVDKNSMKQLLPSTVRDVASLTQLMSGTPDDASGYAKNVWSIYQEQMYDYQNGQRSAPPKWSDVENQAKFLTVIDLFANRLSPLGFKPAPNHEFLVEEFKRMQAADPKNARQNFYDKYGPAAMMFTQSLSTDPSGIPATVGAAAAVKKYAGLLNQFPELGSVIVGPEGNGSFDQMAYDWEVAHGLRKQLSPQDAAKQAQVSLGWAEYAKARAAIDAQVQARGATSLNSPHVKDLRAQLATYVGTFGDKNSPNYNPDFYANYTSFNQNAYQNRITAILNIAQDPALLSNALRSDIRSLQAYSQLRDTTYAQLQQRGGNLKSAKNVDIAQEYDNRVAELMMQDTKFSQLYDRYLAKDDWKEPV